MESFYGITFDLLTISALSLAGAGLLIQLGYFWGLFSRLALYKRDKNLTAMSPQPPVSVVICAHNERHNLEKNLPEIMAQDYDDFEVVVVNDCSDDETEELLIELSRLNPALKVVHLRQSLNFFRSKKFPLSMGIKSAKNELLLLTDADCAPAGKHWISEMIAPYQQADTEVVLGYGPYRRKPGLLNLLIRFDSLQIAMQYLSMALAGRPYMGVGRNLSYKKSLFLKNKGFTSHYNVPSGDDDIFISQVARKRNTKIVFSEAAKTFSEAKPHFPAWFRQKRRHLSTGTLYKISTKFLLGNFIQSQWLFFVGVALLFISGSPWWLPAAFIALRLINQLIIYRKASLKLGEGKLWMITPFAELFFMLFNPLIVFSNLVSRPYTWK
jgi:glycosyltransferase involved in cell wall biosynthesis